MLNRCRPNNERNSMTGGNASGAGLEWMRIGAFWSFWNNNRRERLHFCSFCSMQPPVHSHQHRLCPSVRPPQPDRAWRHDDKRPLVRVAQFVMGWKTIWAKSFYCVIGARVWICSDSPASPCQCEGWRSANVLHCHPAFSVLLVSHSAVTQHFHHFTIGVC